MVLEKFIDPDTLQAICDEITEDEVTRYFTPEQINAFEVELATKVIEIDARTTLAAKIKKFIENTMHPEMLLDTIAEAISETPELTESGTKSLLSEKEVLKKKLKDRCQTSEEKLYKFKDHENGLVAYYDMGGHLISSRNMFPNERQAKLFNIKQA